MRLDRFLSNLKYNTRSKIGKDIKAGLVKVDGKTILDSHYHLDPSKNIVHYDGELVIYREIVNLAIYKPIGFLSANKDDRHQVITSLLKDPYDRFTFKIAGRLDLDSEGLLILTTSGTLVNEITNPKKIISKRYLVKTNLDLSNFETLLEGVIIKDGKNEDFLAKAKSIKRLASAYFEIEITEGKFHQVKRMFNKLGAEVINLKRVQIGKLKLGTLKPGEYREFMEDEVI